MNIVFLGLGSNLNQPRRQMHRAIAELKTLPKTYFLQHTPIVQTTPWGGVKGQPPYLNCIAALKTLLTPETLLDYCQAIEQKQGRVRKIKWGARTIDIDILLFENQIKKTKALTIPHPYILKREFVYQPLFDIITKLNLNTNNFYVSSNA